MNDEQLLRYSRQIMLPQLDVAGQQRLRDAGALILGLGGLGSVAAMYLAAAGIGRLVLVDDDQVDLTNLQRQIVHGTGDIGRAKVDSAHDTLKELNPEVAISTVARRPVADELRELVAGVDVVLDASDNFPTRYLVNEACVRVGRPLVSGAAIRMEGQLSVFAGHDQAPCYRCLYPGGEDNATSCSENGVLAPVVGVIGSLQAVEAIKLVTGIGEPLLGRLLVWDAMLMEWRSLRLKKDPACPVCAAGA